MRKMKTFAALAAVVLLLSCADRERLAPTPPADGGEPAELVAVGQQIDGALTRGDAVALKSLILDRSLSDYSDAIDANPGILPAFGEIFTKRSFVSCDGLYAVYKIQHAGSVYEVAFGVDRDGNWKLVDF